MQENAYHVRIPTLNYETQSLNVYYKQPLAYRTKCVRYEKITSTYIEKTT